MANANNIYFHLGLNTTEFTKRLKKVDADLATKLGQKKIIKLEADDSQLKQQLLQIEKLGNKITFGKNNKKVSSAKDAFSAINYYEKKAAKSTDTKEINKYQKLIGLAQQYLQILSDIGNKKYQQQLIDSQIQTQQRRAAREQAYQAQRQLLNRDKTITTISEKLGLQRNILGSLIGYVSRYVSAFSLVNVGKKVAETLGYFEQQRVALEGILKSAGEAQKLISAIKQFSVESPFQAKELIDYTKQLSAFGIPKENLFKTTKELADISTGLGVDMSRIILAYGQVRSASVLRGQELRQFTEAGIPMVEALANKFEELTGKVTTTADVFDLISKRQISFEMVASVLSDMTKEGGKFYNIQQNITNTTYGQIQKLKDIWTLSLEEIGKSSSSFINTILKGLQKIAGNARTLLAAFTVMIPINLIMGYIGRIRNELQKAKGAAVSFRDVFTSKNFLGNLKSGLIQLGIGALVGVIAKVYDELTRLDKKMNEISSSFDRETEKMVDGFNSLINKMREANSGSQAWKDAYSTLVSNYSEYVNVNDTLITSLNKELDITDELAKKYEELNKQVTAAIALKNEYEKIKTQKDELEKTVANEAADESFWSKFAKRTGDIFGDAVNTELNFLANKSGVKKHELLGIENDVKPSEITNDFRESANKSVTEWSQETGLSFDELKKIFIENIKNQFVGIDITDELGIALGNIIRVYYNNIDEDLLNELKDKNDKLSGEGTSALAILTRAEKAFELDFSNLPADLTKKERYLAEQNAYRGLFSDDSNIVKDINNIAKGEGVVGAIKEFEELMYILKDGDKSIRDTYVAFDELLNTISSGERRVALQRIIELYKQHTDALTEDEERIANRMDKNSTWKGIDLGTVVVDGMEHSLQAFADKFNPYLLGDKTKEQTQEDIKKEYETLKGRLDDFSDKSESNPIWGDEIKLINNQIAVLRRLAGSDLYDVQLEDEKTGGGNKNRFERVRVTNFFDELLSLVIKAKDETKKIVGVTGYTEGLGSFVESLSPDNFLKGFYQEGVNPFKDFFKLMEDNGITEFMPKFNEDSIKTIFRDAGWEEGKELSIPDFEKIYKNIVEVFGKEVLTALRSQRASSKDAAEKDWFDKTINTLQEYQSKSLKDMKTIFGGDEIENKLDSMIRELSNINGNLEKQKSMQDMFNRISKSSNYLTANSAIYGDTPYKRFDTTGAIVKTLQDTISETEKGISSTNPMQALSKLLEGGNLNISNLSALTEIIYDLNEQMSAMEIQGEDGETHQNFEQFKNVTTQISTIIKSLIDSLLSDFEKLQALRNKEQVSIDNITQAQGVLKDSKEVIDANTTGEKNDQMTIAALQNYYNTLLKELGGAPINDWVATLYKDKNSKSGVSSKGLAMNAIFGGLDLAGLVSQSYASKVANKEMTKEAAVEKANQILATIEATAAVFNKVDEAVQAMLDVGRSVINAMNAVDNRLNLKKGSNGALYDKDGNLNIDEEYYEKQNRRDTAMQAMNTIGNFSTGISDAFQKVLQGDFFAAFSSLFTTITNLIGDIAGSRDSQIRHQQEELIRSNEKLSRSMNGLEHALKDAAGVDKYDVQTEQITNLQRQKQQYDLLLALENEKKNGDSAKAQEYADAAVETQRKIDDIMNNIQADVMGTADQLATTLTDPLVNAFRNGENAARAWRDAVKSYIGDVLKEILMTKVVAPKIQSLLDSFMGENTSSDDILTLFKDEDKVGGLVDDLNSLGSGLIEDFNNLPSGIRDLIGFNGGTSELSGGISGITEDTARQLEGLANSQLMQLVIVNSYLNEITALPFAQVQVSWFDGVLENMRYTREATERIDAAISDMRAGVRPLSVVVA